MDGLLCLQVAGQDILDGVADFTVSVYKAVTVIAQQDIVKQAVQMTDGALAVYWVIVFHTL